MAKGTCTVPGCGLRRNARGYCQRHYNQWTRDPDNVGSPIREYGPPRWARDPDMRKFCTRCAEWLDETCFSKSKAALDGLQHHCRECRRGYYRANAEAVRDSMRQRRFAIDRAAFDALLESQGSACAICGTTDPGKSHWNVDHDHSCCAPGAPGCGKCIRGLLCSRCNHGLGHFKDDPARLRAAIDYLTR